MYLVVTTKVVIQIISRYSFLPNRHKVKLVYHLLFNACLDVCGLLKNTYKE